MIPEALAPARTPAEAATVRAASEPVATAEATAKEPVAWSPEEKAAESGPETERTASG